MLLDTVPKATKILFSQANNARKGPYTLAISTLIGLHAISSIHVNHSNKHRTNCSFIGIVVYVRLYNCFRSSSSLTPQQSSSL